MDEEVYIRIHKSIIGFKVMYIRKPHRTKIESTFENRDAIKSIIPMNDLFVLYGYNNKLTGKIIRNLHAKISKSKKWGYAQYNIEYDGIARLQKVSLDGEVYTDKNHSHPDLWMFFDYDFNPNELEKIVNDNQGHAKVFWKNDRCVYISHNGVWIREVKEY